MSNKKNDSVHTGPDKVTPNSTSRGEKAKREREERSARALRDNLRRRKTQVRERQAVSGNKPDPGDDSSGS